MDQHDEHIPGEMPQWHEEFLEISPNIYSTFPKSRPPVALYHLGNAWSVPRLYCKALTRLAPPRQAEAAGHCRAGTLFLHRSDYEDYARHLGRHLAAALTEPSLRPEEIASIFFHGLSQRVEEFFQNPVDDTLERLGRDLAILCEYIWASGSQATLFRSLLGRGNDLVSHSVKVCLAGTTVYSLLHDGLESREGMVEAALGFILHDLGMVNVPRHVYEHEHRLLFANRKRIEEHTAIGLKMAGRLREAGPMTVHCIGQHHERLDGSGYPAGCKAEAIAPVARLCAVADSFCAMTADRTYAAAMAPARAASILLGSPARYDQDAAKALATLVLDEQGQEPAPGPGTAGRAPAPDPATGQIWAAGPSSPAGAGARPAGPQDSGGGRTPVERTEIREGTPAFAPAGTAPGGDLRVVGAGTAAAPGQGRTPVPRTTIRDGRGTTPMDRTSVAGPLDTGPVPVDMEGLLEDSRHNLWRRPDLDGDGAAGSPRPAASRRKHRRLRLGAGHRIAALFWPSDPLSLPDGAVSLARPLFEAEPQAAEDAAGEHIVDISAGGIRLCARQAAVSASLPGQGAPAFLLLRLYVRSQDRHASYLVRGIVRHASSAAGDQVCLGIEFTDLRSIRNAGGAATAAWESVRGSRGGNDFQTALAQLDYRA